MNKKSMHSVSLAFIMRAFNDEWKINPQPQVQDGECGLHILGCLLVCEIKCNKHKHSAACAVAHTCTDIYVKPFRLFYILIKKDVAS
jgi:hypothetical protein